MSKKKASKEEALIKDYRDYVLWRRVSTKEQGKSELGLEAQLTYALEFTKKEPVQVFTDVVSGTKLRECTNLWKAIDYCKEHGTYLLIAKTDRFRNVEEACEVLRKVGEENLRFCDLPNCNEMVLKMLWVVWEYQARMGQINTRLAMKEIKSRIKRDGGFVSKSGNFCDHLGRKKGDRNPNAVNAMAQQKIQAALEWKRRSPLYLNVVNMLRRGDSRAEILERAAELYEEDPIAFGTRDGCKLSKGVLSKWATETLIRN